MPNFRSIGPSKQKLQRGAESALPPAIPICKKPGLFRIKSLVASKSVYVATMMSVPQKFCDTLKSLHKEFIWNGKKAKIKHSSLIGEYSDGGLKDLENDAKIVLLKILRVRQLKDSNFHPWKVLANHLLSPVKGEAILQTEKLRQRTNDLLLFHKELILIWEKYSVSKSLTVGQTATSVWAKLPHLCGAISLYRQNLRAFTMNR